MNTRIILAVGLSILIGHGSALAAPRERRVAAGKNSGAREVRSSMGAVAPQKMNGEEAKAPALSAPVIAGGTDEEQSRYEQVKAKAKQDPDVVALKAKSDRATTEQDIRQASTDYNRALFQKMRKMDRSVAEYSGLVEAAILKRINQ